MSDMTLAERFDMLQIDLAAAESQRDQAQAEVAAKDAALEKIARGVTEVFDADDLKCMVQVSMDEEEMSEIARQALSASPSPVAEVVRALGKEFGVHDGWPNDYLVGLHFTTKEDAQAFSKAVSAYLATLSPQAEGSK